MNQELTEVILHNPDHRVTKTLIYVHSMETFIYKDVKKACLNRDCTKVLTLGPFAVALF